VRRISHRSSLLTLAIASLTLLHVAASTAATPVSVAKGSNGSVHFVIGSQSFIPVGVNYLVQHVGAPYQTFDMFDAKTFNAKVIDQNLSEIAADGFNVVRLWLKGFDPDNGFGLGPDQVSDAYADNVLQTLQQAQRDGLRIILTGAFKQGMWLPKNYLPTESMPGTDVVGGVNRLIMLPRMADAAGQFYHDLLVKIAAKDASALDTILYFDLYNELHFDLHQPPFSSTSGHYDFADQSYDLSSGMNRQALMDSTATAWLRTVSAKVKAVAPHILVTASSFYLVASGRTHFDGGLNAPSSKAPLPFPINPKAMIMGGADILDIHTYPSPASQGLSAFHSRAHDIMMSEGLSAAKGFQLPLIAGEFGPSESKLYRQADALAELSATKITFCTYYFSGYIVWLWMPGNLDALPTNAALSKLVVPKLNPEFCGQQIRQR
jgi:hypothetical protein